MREVSEVCYCPPAWEPLQQRFLEVIGTDASLPAFNEGFASICEETIGPVMKTVEIFGDVSFGTHGELRELARSVLREGNCLSGLAIGAYVCLSVGWFAYDYAAMERLANIAAKLLVFADGCFEPGRSRWKVTSGQVWQQVRDMIMGEPHVEWAPKEVPLCVESVDDGQKSLIGYCGTDAAHKVDLGMAGPLEPVAEDDVVLCTHTSSDSLSLVKPMLQSWRGPASVAVHQVGIQVSATALHQWIWSLGELGLRQVRVSSVGLNAYAKTAYDRLYPANILRQAAVDAAVGRWILLADPGFVPSVGFHRSLSASADLGVAVRAISEIAPTAFAVAGFVIFNKAPEGLEFDHLAQLVDSGEAVSFDAHVCFLCRSLAWQWFLLNGPSALRFQAVEAGDLHHPTWLVERSILPRLPGYLHGLVTPRSGAAKLGWTALPSGLKASAEQLRASGVQMLLLPCAFLHRQEVLPLPSNHWEDLNDWFPLHFFFDLLLRRVLAGLPQANWTNPVQRSLVIPGRLVEVLPARQLVSDIVLLKRGSDASLQLVVMASTVVASEGLELLLSSVPWSVYAVAVGAKDYWATTMQRLPAYLRTLPANSLVAIVDAYDVVLFPCSRSVVEEYAGFSRDIVWAADTSCFPNPAVCTSCEERYAPDHAAVEACRAFPYLNGGCYMGSAAALAHALEWMRWHGTAGGKDDQENKWHYYNHFPDRVVLDHQQRIFSCFFGHTRESFHIRNCSVVSNDTGREVCFAHANGGTKFEILMPLLQELSSLGCMDLPRKRRASAYAGIMYPRLIWS